MTFFLICILLSVHTDHGLDLYKVLAPNAYPQLDGRVQVTDGRVLSQVYDVSCVDIKKWYSVIVYA